VQVDGTKAARLRRPTRARCSVARDHTAAPPGLLVQERNNSCAANMNANSSAHTRRSNTRVHTQTATRAAHAPGSLMRLKKEPSAVNMSVLLKDVMSPMADRLPNHSLCSTKEEAPAGRVGCAKTCFWCARASWCWPGPWLVQAHSGGVLTATGAHTRHTAHDTQHTPHTRTRARAHARTGREGARERGECDCGQQPHKVAGHEGLEGAVAAGPPVECGACGVWQQAWAWGARARPRSRRQA
jgi:hypothetical protein